MFLINGQRAILKQYNRDQNDNVFDDENYREVYVKVCPYNMDIGIRFGIYSVPEAIGYYQISRFVDVQEGDQIIFLGNSYSKNDGIKKEAHTILKVQDSWIFNRVENKILAIK